MNKKWLCAIALVIAVPALVLAQTDIAVENTGVVERPVAEGQILPETHNVHTILWTDSGADSYDIFASDAPIADIDAANVVQIATGVKSGQQAYEYALQTPGTPGAVNNYYAVVASGSSAITAGVNATTEATAGTSEWSQPFYWFEDEPFIDADFSDWPFDPVAISPDNPDNFSAGEIDGAGDFSGNMAMGTTATDIFLRIEMTDDIFVNAAETDSADIWQGDSAEWYMGFYDLRPSAPRHPATQFGNESDPSMAEPDWQLVIAANAFDEPRRSFLYDAGVAGALLAPMAAYGLEVFTAETGAGGGGWNAEGRVPYAGLELDPTVITAYEPVIGHINPVVYVANDGDDPTAGRQGQLFWAQDESVNNAWNTPSAWQKEHTIYDPRVFSLGGGTAVEATTWGSVKAGMRK